MNEQAKTIPTNIITGFLGVGKTTTINALLAKKPQGESWAVLVNEFGQVGIDQEMMPTEDGLHIKETGRWLHLLFTWRVAGSDRPGVNRTRQS
ncbi:GTP-binding protein [Vibrio sp. CDRSL-10 TSBA]